MKKLYLVKGNVSTFDAQPVTEYRQVLSEDNWRAEIIFDKYFTRKGFIVTDVESLETLEDKD